MKIKTTLALVLLVGCTTLATFENRAGQFLSSTALIVDAAMKGWGVYVASGHATAEDEVQVKTIYMQYQADMMVATNAYVLAVKLSDPTIFESPSNRLFTTKSILVTAVTKGKP